MTDIRYIGYCTCVLFVFFQALAGQLPMTCFPSCSSAEISATEHYLKAEIALLEGKQKNLQVELSSLENDIAFLRFNERITQVRSVIRGTNENEDQDQGRSTSLKSTEKADERVQILRQAILEIEKEKRIFLGHLSDLALLIPVYVEEQ